MLKTIFNIRLLVLIGWLLPLTVRAADEERATQTQQVAALVGMVTLQADVTANDETDQVLLKRFGIVGPPAILFFGPDGRERREYRLVGFLEAARFAEHLRSLLARKG